MKPKKIVVIDTGIDIKHENILNHKIAGFGVKCIDRKIDDYKHIIEEDFIDKLGHGTAICSIILNNIKSDNVELICIKVFHQEDNHELKTELHTLLYTLKYILNSIECDIVHMSFGIDYNDSKLFAVCNKLTNRGTILVSAFNNNGSVSFPAAYKNVIGVDSSPRCTKPDDFVFVEDGLVNIRAKGGNQRVAWVKPAYIINQGSSFAAPYVTAQICNLLCENYDYNQIINYFKENSKYIYEKKNDSWGYEKKEKIKIKNAVLFPFNKEMHSIINFSHLLDFNIVGLYDTKYSGKIGTKYKDIFGKTKFEICAINEMESNQFDTIILGHINELEKLSNQNYKSYIIEFCLKNKKNLFCFDEIDCKGYDNQFIKNKTFLYYPFLNKVNLNHFGKLYNINTPLLAIVGTTSYQGKFTLQLQLREFFIKNDYKLGQLGSEPSSLLFAMNDVLPVGYNSIIKMTHEELIICINYKLHVLDCMNNDIIIIGTQSGVTPFQFNNIRNINLPSIDILLASNPDAIIVCVNISDELEYIERTIKTIEGCCAGKVIALAIYPMSYKSDWEILKNKMTYLDDNTINKFKLELKEYFGLNSYVIGSYQDIEILFNETIEFF